MTRMLAKNATYLTLASTGQKVVAFLYFLFLARVMQPENTGAYFLALSITIIFSVIADFGITSVVIREIAKARGCCKAYSWSPVCSDYLGRRRGVSYRFFSITMQ